MYFSCLLGVHTNMLTISVTENKPGWRGAVDGGDYDTGWEPILGD